MVPDVSRSCPDVNVSVSATAFMTVLHLTKLGIVLILCCASVLAYPGKPFDLQKLVAGADIIVVADISRIDPAGATTITVDGRAVPADASRADVHAERHIKGMCPDQFTLTFFTPKQFLGYPGVAVGRQVIFLTRRDSGYEFADRHFPSLPTAPGSVSDIESDPLSVVVAELGRVISSPVTGEGQKYAVLARARGIPNTESFKLSLQAGLDTAESADLRYRIQAELVSRDDLFELRQVIDLLLGNTLTEDQRQVFLLVIANNIKSSESVQIITPLLRTTDPLSRRAVAEALWHTASSNAIPDLVRILQDPDQQVRFYAVRALSDIANVRGWGGPSESEFQEHQQEYLTHWQNWAKTRVP